MRTVDSDSLTIIGTYMPDTSQPLEKYTECLETLEHKMTEYSQEGPCIIAGDLNAHFGSTEGVREGGTPNARGLLWKEVLRRTDAFAVSLSDITTGPSYTYASGVHRTTVDYFITSESSAPHIESCMVHEEDPLNTSDHLPISLLFGINPRMMIQSHNWGPRIDWRKARSSNCLTVYQSKVDEVLRPVINGTYNSIEDVDREITKVMQGLREAALLCLPKCKGKKRCGIKVRDSVLRERCRACRVAHLKWKQGGRPDSGPLLDERFRTKRAVRERLKFCEANQERKRLQKRDEMYKSRDTRRFHNPGSKKNDCVKLLQNGEVITNTSDLLNCWSDHFECLGRSVPDKHVKCSKEKIPQLNTLTLEREDYVFDCEITVEEIEQALKRLKLRKASGQDGIVSEHLKFGGQMLVIWLKQVLNAIVEMEEIPQSFKHSIVIPVFKGKGRDSLKKDNYRGIALTPVIAKLLEFITLACLQPILEELEVPSRMQTVYRKHTSCDDAIFANLEAMSHYLAQEDRVMMCSFDLEKAFDTIE